MCTQVKTRAIDAILPAELIGQIQKPSTKKAQEISETTMITMATLVVNLIRETILYVEKKQPKGLDAFPADRMCQGRLIILPELFETPEIYQELKLLKLLVEKIKPKLQVLKERIGSQNCSPAIFFEKEIGQLEISKDVHYLLDCRLLTVTRGIQFIDSNGIINSRIDHGNLSILSPKMEMVDSQLRSNFREQITLNACTRVSARTMERLQEMSSRMKVPKMLQRMVDVVVVYKDNNYPPKSFGCQFFTIQLALRYLLETKTLIAIKTIVTKDKTPHLIFFQAGEKDFELLDSNQIHRVPKTSYIAIFQAVVFSEEKLIDKIKEMGFIELILRFGAQDTPFQHKSSIDDVKDPEARQVLEEYRKKAAESKCLKDCDPFLLVHHLYSTTLQEEVK